MKNAIIGVSDLRNLRQISKYSQTAASKPSPLVIFVEVEISSFIRTERLLSVILFVPSQVSHVFNYWLRLHVMPANKQRNVSFYNSSAVAEMGDRLTAIDMNRKVGHGAAVSLFVGELGPHLTHYGAARGLFWYQVAS